MVNAPGDGEDDGGPAGQGCIRARRRDVQPVVGGGGSGGGGSKRGGGAA